MMRRRFAAAVAAKTNAEPANAGSAFVEQGGVRGNPHDRRAFHAATAKSRR
jgi:hypothetical protein